MYIDNNLKIFSVSSQFKRMFFIHLFCINILEVFCSTLSYKYLQSLLNIYTNTLFVLESFVNVQNFLL